MLVLDGVAGKKKRGLSSKVRRFALGKKLDGLGKNCLVLCRRSGQVSRTSEVPEVARVLGSCKAQGIIHSDENMRKPDVFLRVKAENEMG